MKKFFILLTIAILLGVFIIGLSSVLAEETVQAEPEMTYFYGNTCPHCKKAGEFLSTFEEKYPELTIIKYEVFDNKENADLLDTYFDNYQIESVGRGVPAIFIGEQAIIGYLSDETTGQRIETAVKQYLGIDSKEQEPDKKEYLIEIPFFGPINAYQLSLPVLTIVIGALDGFNPCAMWALLFIIALLINTRSRKKMLLVGGTFILASGLVYYVILTAWLNLFLSISYIALVRMTIGAIAIGIGIWQIKSFITYQPGVCKVVGTNEKLHQKITAKIKKITQPAALPATLAGIIVLAIGINMIEFVCSVGLPAFYTNVLALNELSTASYYLYLLLYTFVFMLDDMLIFAIAFVTLSKIGFTDKYTKWGILIGGLIILLLGFLLIFKPDLLMFG